MAQPCNKNCVTEFLIANQNGELNQFVNGRWIVPQYGPHPTVNISAAETTPLEVVQDATDPYKFEIRWKASNPTNQLIAADGTTVLFTAA